MRPFSNLFVILMLLCSSSIIYAAEVASPVLVFPPAKAGFQLRLDAVGGHKKVDGAPAIEQQSFVVKTARIAVFGDLSDELSYFIRLDVATPLFTTNYVGHDGSVAALERAFFTQKWTDWLTMRVGRINAVAGSVEIDYSSMDQYVNSYLTDQYIIHIFPTTTGAELAATTGVQTVTLQLLDGMPAEDPGFHKGTQIGSEMTWTLGYRAKFWDGLFKPILTYDRAGRVRAGEGAAQDERVIYTAVGTGAQFSYAHTDVDLEYDTLSRPEFTSHTWSPAGNVTAVDNKTQKINTMVGQVAYTFEAEHLRTFIKWASDRENLDGLEHLHTDRGGIGIEYRPLSPRNMRYHAVYTYRNDTTIATDHSHSLTETAHFIVGMAAKI